jgi:hypothetical protein
MRRFLAIGTAAVLLGCGGDSTSPPPFPAAAGTYRMDITFSDFPPSIVNASGTITITQASRKAPELGGTANITVFASGQSTKITTLTNASVTEAGQIRFQLPPPNTSSTWGFDGSIVAGGRMNGTHILVGSTSSFAGTWTATKQ